MNRFGRLKQCEGCPWKTSNDLRTIPNGPCRESVRKLYDNRANGLDPGFLMACHDSPIGQEQACVGWVVNQIGPGNNIALRLAALRGRFDVQDMVTEGDQHPTIDSMVAVYLEEESA